MEVKWLMPQATLNNYRLFIYDYPQITRVFINLKHSLILQLCTAMQRVFFLFLTFFIVGLSHANNGDYLTVTVKKGDFLLKILEHYHLRGYQCNLDAFYSINNMEKGDHLLSGFEYKLPIQLYQYNGTSIRSTIGNDDWDLAIAIQDYNKALKEANVKSYYMDDKLLYVPYHLVNCGEVLHSVNSGETVKTTKVEEKIEYVDTEIYFGKAKIKKESNDLNNQVFYILSGHGGPDPGAMCRIGNASICEDEYAYDVSLRLAKLLLQNGAIVHLIIQDPNDGIRDESILKIDHDEICKTKDAIPLNQVKRLRQRVDAVNELYEKERKSDSKKTHKVISIHVDSRSRGLKQDVFFYHAPGSNSGNLLANRLQDVFRAKYEMHQKGRGYEGSVSSRNLYVLRNTTPTAVFVELANIQNKHNHKRILPYTNRQVLANWLYEGLIN